MDDSSSSLSYTVGFSIAITAILLFAIFQIVREIFRQILKYLAKTNEVQVIEIEKKNGESLRKLSVETMKRLQESMAKDTTLSEANRVEVHVENEKKFDGRRKSMVRKENVHHKRNFQRPVEGSVRFNREKCNEVTFFAGYSHKMNNEV